MAFSESLDVYFTLKANGGLADPGLYDGATEVVVLFDNPYQEALSIAGTMPMVTGKASVFPANAVGKSLVVGGASYSIVGREPVDDGALVMLRLKRL